MAENEARLTVRLAGDARQAISKLSKMMGGASVADVIRRSIGTELFLMEEQERGAKILIQDKDGTRQLLLR
jgi:hypothetical protein